MSRSNSVYKETYNRCLDYLTEIGLSGRLPPENEFAEKWGISRTTVRAVLEHLNQSGIIRWKGRSKSILRLPTRADYYAKEETLPAARRVEIAFMEHVLGGDLKPDAILHESDLAREFGTSTSAIREFLIRFSRFGLIAKEPNRHWVLRGFTREFAIELFDVREMFETRAFNTMLAVGPEGEGWIEAVSLEEEHRRVITNIDEEYLRFPLLDERFHNIWIARLENRFADDFFKLVSMIFHFHYRWNKADEKGRNLAAAREHLAAIEAMKEADVSAARAAIEVHLQSARRTLLSSVQWD
jgi:DNA-binding GntR family transcriptional regulator